MCDEKQISFNTMKEFGEITKIECFDEIIVRYKNFSGLGRILDYGEHDK